MGLLQCVLSGYTPKIPPMAAYVLTTHRCSLKPHHSQGLLPDSTARRAEVARRSCSSALALLILRRSDASVAALAGALLALSVAQARQEERAA